MATKIESYVRARETKMERKTSTNREPFVSIVIPNWNGKKILRECLHSLISQNYRNREIIVVDNASADGSPDIIREEFPDVKLIINERNLGWAGGCNVGIKVAKGNLIALFNNDAVADPDWLSELVNAMETSSDLGIVGGIVFCDEPRDIIDNTGLRLDPISGVVWRANLGNRLAQVEDIEDIDFVSGVSLLLRRELIEKVGLLDENYFLYQDETDFGMSAKRAGFRCRIVPSAFVWHMGARTVRKLPMEGYYLRNRSNFRFYLKNLPPKYLFTIFFFQLVVVPTREALLFKNPLFFTLKTKAFLWNLARFREILARRKENRCLGKIRCRNRLREFLQVAKHRIYAY